MPDETPDSFSNALATTAINNHSWIREAYNNALQDFPTEIHCSKLTYPIGHVKRPSQYVRLNLKNGFIIINDKLDKLKEISDHGSIEYVNKHSKPPTREKAHQDVDLVFEDDESLIKADVFNRTCSEKIVFTAHC